MFAFRSVQWMPKLMTGAEHQQSIGVVRNKDDPAAAFNLIRFALEQGQLGPKVCPTKQL